MEILQLVDIPPQKKKASLGRNGVLNLRQPEKKAQS